MSEESSAMPVGAAAGSLSDGTAHTSQGQPPDFGKLPCRFPHGAASATVAREAPNGSPHRAAHPNQAKRSSYSRSPPNYNPRSSLHSPRSKSPVTQQSSLISLRSKSPVPPLATAHSQMLLKDDDAAATVRGGRSASPELEPQQQRGLAASSSSSAAGARRAHLRLRIEDTVAVESLTTGVPPSDKVSAPRVSTATTATRVEHSDNGKDGGLGASPRTQLQSPPPLSLAYGFHSLPKRDHTLPRPPANGPKYDGEGVSGGYLSSTSAARPRDASQLQGGGKRKRSLKTKGVKRPPRAWKVCGECARSKTKCVRDGPVCQRCSRLSRVCEDRIALSRAKRRRKKAPKGYEDELAASASSSSSSFRVAAAPFRHDARSPFDGPQPQALYLQNSLRAANSDQRSHSTRAAAGARDVPTSSRSRVARGRMPSPPRVLTRERELQNMLEMPPPSALAFPLGNASRSVRSRSSRSTSSRSRALRGAAHDLVAPLSHVHLPRVHVAPPSHLHLPPVHDLVAQPSHVPPAHVAHPIHLFHSPAPVAPPSHVSPAPAAPSSHLPPAVKASFSHYASVHPVAIDPHSSYPHGTLGTRNPLFPRPVPATLFPRPVPATLFPRPVPAAQNPVKQEISSAAGTEGDHKGLSDRFRHACTEESALDLTRLSPPFVSSELKHDGPLFSREFCEHMQRGARVSEASTSVASPSDTSTSSSSNAQSKSQDNVELSESAADTDHDVVEMADEKTPATSSSTHSQAQRADADTRSEGSRGADRRASQEHAPHRENNGQTATGPGGATSTKSTKRKRSEAAGAEKKTSGDVDSSSSPSRSPLHRALEARVSRGRQSQARTFDLEAFADKRIEVLSSVLHERESSPQCAAAFKHWRVFALYEGVAFRELGEAYASAVKHRLVSHSMSASFRLPPEVTQGDTFISEAEPLFEVVESPEMDYLPVAVLAHEVSSSEPARIRVLANKKFRSLFKLVSPPEDSNAAANLLEDVLNLTGTIVDESSWGVYLRMWVSALASGEAQKSVCALRPVSVVCDLDTFYAVVQLSVTACEGCVKIVHTFADFYGLS